MAQSSVLSMARTWKFWKEMLTITVAMFIAAAAVYYFLMPSKLVIGSISGLSIVLSGIFANMGIVVKVSTIVLIINAILLVLAYFLIGSEFGVKTDFSEFLIWELIVVW